MATKLFSLIQKHKVTGESKVIYGHVTANVIAQYWEAYVDDEHFIGITEYTQPNIMDTIDSDYAESFEREL